MKITTVGLDLAKNVFQVHAINSASEVVCERRRFAVCRCEGFSSSLIPMPGPRDRGVRDQPLLGARDYQAWPRGAPDASGLCEALRQARQDRCGRCRGDLRGGEASHNAVCRDRNRPISRRRWRYTAHGTCSSNSAHSWST